MNTNALRTHQNPKCKPRKAKTGLLAFTVALGAIALRSSFPVQASEIAVIVNRAAPITSLSKESAQRIFLGKETFLPSSDDKIALRRVDNAGIRSELYQTLVQRNEDQMRAYWASQIFTGRGAPPEQLKDDPSVVDFVAKNEGGIGYVHPGSETAGVKVVLRLPMESK